MKVLGLVGIPPIPPFNKHFHHPILITQNQIANYMAILPIFYEP
jgi:hypothetical protein